ncbi:MAG: bifunctional 5,10-methylenetetrahydrofolate dehydrogenase/5,10-methenyltetrahydrofolate cyclohydrolase [bacterium]|nr:bifunctional 5,10-methylenetetrahydrofolate dehydrogenase/5,10-methenyltetrahydrofolate cyclohydrolase [bacterium]MDZ4299632.1 bifunctional 5,10-methylenetetrahydrofolate dehydrogenase/5,10-methenyltetrahydrofolate cyclohydrolase [Candidatus Sungbacteria bacterium]
MIIVDGKAIAAGILDEVRNEVAASKKKLRLGVVVVGNDVVTRHFVMEKRRVAESVGIDMRVYPFPETVMPNELRARVTELVREEHNTGIIIQLPLPSHLPRQHILNAVTPEKDIDMLSARAVGNFTVGKGVLVPPVVGAIQEIAAAHGVEFIGKNIVVVGAGPLVGRPVVLWLLRSGATFSVVRKSTPDPASFLRSADIIISGIGKPRFITGVMVKTGIAAFDAGTAESEGKIAGDFDDDSVAPKCSLITPVPGGIGPLTVAILLRNLVLLARSRKK